MPTQFWEMTPREIQAFGRVKQTHDERQVQIEEHRTRLWAVTLVDFRNVHFRGRGRAPWTVDEILHGGKPSAPAGLPISDPEEFRIKMIMSGFMKDEDVPEWSRSTVAASKAFEAQAHERTMHKLRDISESLQQQTEQATNFNESIKQRLLGELPPEKL